MLASPSGAPITQSGGQTSQGGFLVKATGRVCAGTGGKRAGLANGKDVPEGVHAPENCSVSCGARRVDCGRRFGRFIRARPAHGSDFGLRPGAADGIWGADAPVGPTDHRSLAALRRSRIAARAQANSRSTRCPRSCYTSKPCSRCCETGSNRPGDASSRSARWSTNPS